MTALILKKQKLNKKITFSLKFFVPKNLFMENKNISYIIYKNTFLFLYENKNSL